MFSILSLVSLINFVIFGFISWYVAPMMLAGFVVNGWVSMRWVWALPVSRRTVLAMALVPPLVLEAAAQATRPAGVIRAIGMVALALLSTSAYMTMHKAFRNWDGLRAGARFLVWPYCFVILCGPFAGMFADVGLSEQSGGFFHRSRTAEFLATYLSGLPAGTLAILIAGMLAGLGALYWLVERQFEAVDFRPDAQTQVGSAEIYPGLNV
jgi:hypothetical protein